MNRKTNTALIALLGTILMGLATWTLVTLIELFNDCSYASTRNDGLRQGHWENLLTYG